MIHKIMTVLLQVIFHQSPRFDYTEDETKEFDRIYDTAIHDHATI